MSVRILLVLSLVVMSAGAFGSRPEGLGEYYNLLPGSIAFSHAEIVLIGETHNVPLDKHAASAIVSRYAREGDILLLEGIDSSTWFKAVPPSQELGAAAAKLLVSGWDDHEALVELLGHVPEFVRSEAVRNSPSLSAFQRVKAWTNCSYHYFVHENFLDRRNESMRYKLTELSVIYPTKKIFLIAGSNHLRWQRHADLAHLLRKLKRPSSVVIPKESNPLRKKEGLDRDYLDSLVRYSDASRK